MTPGRYLGAHVAADLQSIRPAANSRRRRDAQATAEAAGREFLVFTLGAEEYGIDILKVAGNPRLRQRYTYCQRAGVHQGRDQSARHHRAGRRHAHQVQSGRVEYRQPTVVIILNVARRVVGMVVDGVSDVLTLTQDQVMPAPEFGATLTTEYLTGLGTVEGAC